MGRERRAQRLAHELEEDVNAIVLRRGVVVEHGRDRQQLAPSRATGRILRRLDARVRERARHLKARRGGGAAKVATKAAAPGGAGVRREWRAVVGAVSGGLLGEPRQQRDGAREQPRAVRLEHRVAARAAAGRVPHQTKAGGARLAATEAAQQQWLHARKVKARRHGHVDALRTGRRACAGRGARGGGAKAWATPKGWRCLEECGAEVGVGEGAAANDGREERRAERVERHDVRVEQERRAPQQVGE